ncbi:GNAT family N-acetyltransferase [Lederbergia sp. NSJ-179]|uniref:GNAT family N-acetyltransferase n=1 Tax=Lederbergia sp. NSJ-179 TaxID=2931402 RepID=UPI001FCFF0CA|nr:GNAT family protein [Lederbergia sp. NSJ-179]MCJ7842529.1 GNAT family N-acetyltransferase [Lederbergia sp. NSJ-179]
MYKAEIDSNTYIAILEPRHAEELFALIDGSRESIGKWLAFPAFTNEVQDTRNFIERSLQRLASNNGYWAGIWYKGHIAGSIGFLYLDWGNKKTEIGYWLGKEFKGLGLATKACALLVDHAFTDFQLHKVEIKMATNNEKSKAIPERLGFKREGMIRDYEFLHGEYHDRVIYGLLEDEWKNGSIIKNNE